MEAATERSTKNNKLIVVLILLAVIAIGFSILSSMGVEAQESVIGFLQDYLPIFMFLTLATLLFSGFPVAFILGGLITPTFDPVNQSLVAIPLILLYELGILLARVAGK